MLNSFTTCLILLYGLNDFLAVLYAPFDETRTSTSPQTLKVLLILTRLFISNTKETNNQAEEPNQ